MEGLEGLLCRLWDGRFLEAVVEPPTFLRMSPGMFYRPLSHDPATYTDIQVDIKIANHLPREISFPGSFTKKTAQA